MALIYLSGGVEMFMAASLFVHQAPWEENVKPRPWKIIAYTLAAIILLGVGLYDLNRTEVEYYNEIFFRWGAPVGFYPVAAAGPVHG